MSIKELLKFIKKLKKEFGKDTKIRNLTINGNSIEFDISYKEEF